MPSAVAIGASYQDYFYNNWGDSRNKVAMVGGAWSFGIDAGLFNWSVFISSEGKGMNVGTRILLIN